MSKLRKRSTFSVLPGVLIMTLLVLVGGYSSAQTREVATSVIQVAKLTAADGAEYDYFGRPVSISGGTLVTGASTDDDWGDGSGSAYVFERGAGGSGDWAQKAKLIASDGAADDYFGGAVSISGDTMIVGAYGDDDKGEMSGSAYVFERNAGGAGNWGQVAKLTASDGAEADYFGSSVSISGDTIAIGAMYDDDKGTWSGSCYVFEKPDTGWIDMSETVKVTAADGGENDYFGQSVAIYGDILVVGAPWGGESDLTSGTAYLFKRDDGGLGNWDQVAKLTASDAADSDEFGCSVSISSDIIVVGAYGDDDKGEMSGSAYLFEKPEAGWIDMDETAKLTASDGEELDAFGYSLSNSGDSVVIGAPRDDDSSQSAGSAYLFQRDEGGADNWGQVAKIVASDGAWEDEFGEFVSISGDTIVVGAAHDDDSGANSGSVYVFALFEPVAWIYLPVVLRSAP